MKVNQQQYRQWAKNQKGLPFYLQCEWLDATCGSDHWDASLCLEGNEVIAALPFQISRKYGFTKSHTPDFLPYSGPWLADTKKEKTHHQMAEFEGRMMHLLDRLKNLVDLRFSPEIPYGLPIVWSKFKHRLSYTYQLNYLSVNECFDQFNRTIRKHLNPPDAAVNPISGSAFLRFIDAHGQRYSLKQKQILQNIITTFESSDQLSILGAFRNDACMAVLLAVESQNTGYLLSSAVDKSITDNMGFYRLVWQYITDHPSISKLDFTGSSDIKIARSFRAFSANPVPYSRAVRQPRIISFLKNE